jgi:hypothetical protein
LFNPEKNIQPMEPKELTATRQNFNMLLINPDKIELLKKWEITDLLLYIESEINQHITWTNQIILINSDYPYPDGEDVVQYWLSRNSQFQNLKKIQQLITPQPYTKSLKISPNGIMRFSIDEYALKLTYEGRQVTRTNADVIIREIGLTSGEKLFQRFTYWQSNANRTGKPTPLTPTKFQNKIKMFRKIAELLTDRAKEHAQRDLNTLQTLYDNEY